MVVGSLELYPFEKHRVLIAMATEKIYPIESGTPPKLRGENGLLVEELQPPTPNSSSVPTENAYSIYNSTEKWLIVSAVAVAGFFRFVLPLQHKSITLRQNHQSSSRQHILPSNSNSSRSLPQIDWIAQCFRHCLPRPARCLYVCLFSKPSHSEYLVEM